jgi:hypothetical protein
VDFVWPGGVRNRLYDVRSKENLLFPEIPYSYDTKTLSFGEYAEGVARSLAQMVRIGELTDGEAGRFLSGALRAYRDAHGMEDGGDNGGGDSSQSLPDIAGLIASQLLTDHLVPDNLAHGADGGASNSGNGLGGSVVADSHAILTLLGSTIPGNIADGEIGASSVNSGKRQGGGLHVAHGRSACADDATIIDGNSASTSFDDVFGLLETC